MVAALVVRSGVAAGVGSLLLFSPSSIEGGVGGDCLDGGVDILVRHIFLPLTSPFSQITLFLL